jgi:phospholipase C
MCCLGPTVGIHRDGGLQHQPVGLRGRVFAHCRLRDEETETIRGKVWIDFANTGRAGAAFYVYNGKKPDHNPRRYTVSAGDMLSDYWETSDTQGAYELTVDGPNGYLCMFRGNTDGAASRGKSGPEVKVRYDAGTGDIFLWCPTA